MSAYAPGPWTVVSGVYDTNPETASEFPHGPDVVAADGKIIAACGLYAENDARLIAAAPDLLEALQTALGWMNDGHGLQPPAMTELRQAIDKARAAIAKATGT